MKKIIPYIASIPIVLLGLIPPIDFELNAPSDLMPWFTLIVCFLGVYLLFATNKVLIQVIAIFTLINCFFSSAPYLSFCSYFSIVFCCYFYLLCDKIEDWRPVFRVVQTILFLNLILVFMQMVGKDTLLNFGRDYVEGYGIIGNKMQMGSMSIVLASFLVLFNPLNLIAPVIIGIFCTSAWTILSAGCGIATYFYFYQRKYFKYVLIIFLILFFIFSFKYNKFNENSDKHNGRMLVWSRSIHLANQHPFMGWGIGTYKYVFPPLSNIKSIPWKTAHNAFIQVLFETGYFGFTIMIGFFAWMCYKFFRVLHRKIYRGMGILCLCGFVMMTIDMLCHFPDRMAQAVLIIICFICYCKRRLHYGFDQ